jgi:hypothetical protein
MTPHIIEENLFSKEELSIMLSMLDKHDDLIDKYGETAETMPPTHSHLRPIPGMYFGFFGAANYWSSPEGYKPKGDKTRNLLIESINYDKLCNVITSTTGKKCALDDDLNPPGLHVFANNTDKTRFFEVTNWHQDSFRPGVFIHSWLIPLQLPSNPCGVDYVDDEQIKRFNYTNNTLYAWDGRMPHTISDMLLKPGERRVTLQAHTILKNNGELVLFW